MDGARAQVVQTAVTAAVIDYPGHHALVNDAAYGAAGAIVGFVGAVRNHDGGRSVVRLDYSAHPTAGAVLDEVVEAIAGDAAGVRAIAVSHRTGELEVGDVAFVVAVAADHRRAAFETCERIVENVKAQLPVWKHQIFADGTDEWVGSA